MGHHGLEANRKQLTADPARMRRGRTHTIGALVLLALMAVAAPARAAEVDMVGGVLTYLEQTTMLPVIANDLVVTLAGGTYTLDDPATAAINLSANALAAGCAPFDSNTVTCPAAVVTQINVDVRDGADRITLTGVAVPAVVNGGRDNDTLVGGDAGDIFTWNPGDGSDTIDGGPGNDQLAFNGSNIGEIITVAPSGTGFVLTRNIAAVTMTVDHTEQLVVRTVGGVDQVFTVPLAATSQKFIDINVVGENDVLRIDAGGLCLTRTNDVFETDGREPIRTFDFEQVFVDNLFCPIDPCEGAVPTEGCTVNHVANQPCIGTDVDDVIVGTAGADVILGGAGRDRINAAEGDDLVCAEAGADIVNGGTGNDTLVGGPDGDRLKGGNGNDTLLGNDGDDILTGGAGDDDLDGGKGNDRVVAGGGADTLQGGLGVDRVDGGSGLDHCHDTDEPGPFRRCE